MRPMEKTDLKGALNDLSTYMRKSLGVVVLALVLAALSAVLTIIGPDQVGKIATIMSDGLLGGIDLAAIARVGILLAVIYGLSALFGFIQHYIMASVTLKMSYRIRAELSEKINRVPQKYFNFHAQGDILSRITNDVSTLQQGLTNSLPTIISAATQFLGCLIMMFVTEWRLALVSLGITLVGLLLVVFIMSRSQKYFTARQESLGKLNGYVEEMYSGHDVVRISRANRKIKAAYPADYAYLLSEVYPGLRHSDYAVQYEVRAYTDLAEIRHLLKNQPQKLSLNEMYLVAQEMEPGSDEYNATFATAVRMFPDDPVANLNAANTALRLGDLKGAETYLGKAGDAPEAVYARGIHAALLKDYDAAQPLLKQALQQGVAQAEDALQQIDRIRQELAEDAE